MYMAVRVALSAMAAMGVKKKPASASANQSTNFLGILLFPGLAFMLCSLIARWFLPRPMLPNMAGR